MKILWFTYYFPPGREAASVTIGYQTRFLAQRHEILVCTPFKKTTEKIDNVTVHVDAHASALFRYLFSHIIMGWQIAKICKTHNFEPDVIMGQYHPHHLAAFGAWIASRRLRKPLVLRAHDVFTPPGQSITHTVSLAFTKALNNFAARRANSFLVVTPEIRDYLISRKHFLSSRVRVNTNGVSLTGFPYRGQYGQHTPCRITMIGALQPEEHVDLLLESLQLLKSKQISFECDIIGAGVLVNELQDYIEKNQLSSVVHLRGSVAHDKISGILQQSDICIGSLLPVPTNTYTVHRKIVEYMAIGCPVITVATSTSIVEHEKTALVVSGTDARELAEAIIRFIDHPELARELQKAAHERIVATFSLEKTLPELEHILVTSGGS